MLSRGCVKKHICPVSRTAVCFKDRFKNHFQMQIKTDYAVYIVCFCLLLRNIGISRMVCQPFACISCHISFSISLLDLLHALISCFQCHVARLQSAACCSCCKVLQYTVTCVLGSSWNGCKVVQTQVCRYVTVCVAVCVAVADFLARLQGGESRLSEEGSQWQCCHESGQTSTSRRGDYVVCWKIHWEVQSCAMSQYVPLK